MIAWELLDTAILPDGSGTLRLKRRGAEYSIMLGTNELMNSRLSGSEEALARLSCKRIKERSSPHVLIGGLGMGFTLRAALAELGSGAHVTVAELVPAVVDWARGPMAGLYGGFLDDPRVSIAQTDVGLLIGSSAAASFDAILLDVDNGPEGITHRGNDALYSEAGLGKAKEALKAGGLLAVWSQGPDAGFTRRLKQAGFAVEEVQVRANGKRGARHMIWIATKA